MLVTRVHRYEKWVGSFGSRTPTRDPRPRGQPFGARSAGKLKTVVRCASIAAVLLVLWLNTSSPPFLAWVRDGLTWLAVALTIYSGLVHIRIAMPSLRRESST